jgi:hypothetical protein
MSKIETRLQALENARRGSKGFRNFAGDGQEYVEVFPKNADGSMNWSEVCIGMDGNLPADRPHLTDDDLATIERQGWGVNALRFVPMDYATAEL